MTILKSKIITFLTKNHKVSRESTQKLDLLLLVLETIDLNANRSISTLKDKLQLNNILPNNVIIWKLRNNNPMRKSYIKNSIKVEEFDALIRLTAEMSKYLYPYIREILHSRDNISQSPVAWNDFKERFVELIYERFNINSMRVKKLLDQNVNDEIITKLLLNLSLNISNNGYKKLRTCLLNS